jgi:chromosome segregation ATPase
MANDDLHEQPAQKFTPFETMVLARFDDLTATLMSFHERLETFKHEMNERLEKLESKALDTKRIWERTLAEILNIKAEVVEIKDRLHNVERDLFQVRADLHGFDRRITALENP